MRSQYPICSTVNAFCRQVANISALPGCSCEQDAIVFKAWLTPSAGTRVRCPLVIGLSWLRRKQIPRCARDDKPRGDGNPWKGWQSVRSVAVRSEKQVPRCARDDKSSRDGDSLDLSRFGAKGADDPGEKSLICSSLGLAPH